MVFYIKISHILSGTHLEPRAGEVLEAVGFPTQRFLEQRSLKIIPLFINLLLKGMNQLVLIATTIAYLFLKAIYWIRPHSDKKVSLVWEMGNR